jgi:dolichol-phosphate mannosyltransferase
MAVRKSILEGVNLDPLGWKIVLEVVVKTRARVMDVPIVFADREEGESKLGLKAQVDYLRHLGRLYAFRYPLFFEFIKFCLVGLTGLVVDTTVLVSGGLCFWIRDLQPSLHCGRGLMELSV